MAHDMAAAMGNSTEIRLVPLAASGGVENLRDLVLLRGLDMAIVPANVLAQMKSAEALLGAGLRQRVAYVTQLYADEVHLLVGRGVSTIEGLKRSRIAVPPDDGTAEFTARDVLERLGIEMEIVRLHPTVAIEQIRSGELAAGLFVGAKPLQLVAHLPKDGRLRLMGLPYPKTMEEGYLPAAFRAEDYPALVPPGSTIETVATSAVLMANIARGYEESVRRVAKFVPLFFDSVAELTPLGQNPKWKELNLAAPLPGWTRHPAAEEWLNTAKEKQRAVLQKSFDDFLLATRPPGSPTLTPAERKKLFESFIDWTRQSVRAARGSERP